jgi:hypothetical protein
MRGNMNATKMWCCPMKYHHGTSAETGNIWTAGPRSSQIL